MQPTPTDLALVVIARNEAACIERCLLSVKPFVDRMVVLDTGSTDDTVAIAQACGAVVNHMAWSNDFSAARNAALDIANADWNLVLDADEWLEAGGEHLRTLGGANPMLGVLRMKNDTGNDTDTAETVSQLIAWLPRVLPRGVRYVGRIHEQPVSSLPAVRLPITLRHDGYTAAKMQKKGERNTQLLLDELKHQPDNPYVLFQLGKETELHHENYAKAADYYERAIGLAPHDAPYRRNLALRYLYSLGKSDRLEQAMAHADASIRAWPDFPDLCFALGLVLLDAAVKYPEQAQGDTVQWLPLAEQAFRRCLEIGDKADMDGSVIGRGSFLAAQQLATVYQMQANVLAGKSEHYLALSKQLQDTPQPLG
ncbi:glycosyltransferase family 2 protein [Ralstonia sp. UBA689]|uniref:glycosyltransferase family 2 protein n=1 Tax=Ralstonia sp. UBA689 TaxID=1947373 RepID=UPI0025D3BE0F|nr:glycosyltransferase [Ralstonia sp. UBA689]